MNSRSRALAWDPTTAIEALAARYLRTRNGRPVSGSIRDDGPVGPVPTAGPVHDPRTRFTLHLTFPAADLDAARAKAASYAGGLALLRPELAADPPVLSRADEWNHVHRLFCGRPGPEGESCGAPLDHLGCHRSTERGTLCWGDADVPPYAEPTGNG